MRLIIVVLCLVSVCLGATITTSLPDFDSSGASSGFPIDLGVIGIFAYALPLGSTITSASIGGTFGTAAVPTSTAGFDIVIAGSTITACVPNASNCWQPGAPLRPFSFSLPSSTFATLMTGSVPIDIVQTNALVVRYGTPTLTVNYASIPEPASSVLVVCGALAFIAFKKRWTCWNSA
jgi:hypothetical protein